MAIKNTFDAAGEKSQPVHPDGSEFSYRLNCVSTAGSVDYLIGKMATGKYSFDLEFTGAGEVKVQRVAGWSTSTADGDWTDVHPDGGNYTENVSITLEAD